MWPRNKSDRPSTESHLRATQPMDISTTFKTEEQLRIEPLDIRSDQPVFQIITSTRRFQANQHCVDALHFFSVPRTLSDFDEWISDRITPEVDTDTFNRAKSMLLASGLVKSCEGDISIRADEGKRPTPLRFRKEILSSSTLDSSTSILSILYSSPIWQLSISALFAAYLALFTTSVSGEMVSTANWWTLLGLVVVSLFSHELGHLAACRFFKRHHGGIGWGLFFVYPVLYADVSECWSLPRYKRAVVDLGGVYFQLMFGAIVALYALCIDSSTATAGAVTILVCALFNLNPFFRLDGYWFLSDICGVPSLDRLRSSLMRQCWNRLFKRSTESSATRFQTYPAWINMVAVLYACISLSFLIYLGTRVYFGLPVAVAFIAERALELGVAASRGDLKGTLVGLLPLIAGLFTLVILTRLASRLVIRCYTQGVQPTVLMLRPMWSRAIVTNALPRRKNAKNI